MDSLLQDFRYAFRKLIRTPGFAVVAVLTLGLAIGANTAIFSVVNGVLLRPLAFEDPERLVQVLSIKREGEARHYPLSAPDFIDYRTQSKSIAAMAAIERSSVNLTGAGEPQRLSVTHVSANFWTLLGVTPAIGRGFLSNEDSPNAEAVVVLSDSLWRSRFGGDRAMVGKTIFLNGAATTVVGVAPAGFRYPFSPDVWTPLVFSTDALDPGARGMHWLRVIGRLAPRATPASAATELAAIAKRLETAYPTSNTNFSATAIPMQEFMVGNVRRALFVLLGAVAFVLLIACANVANLLLVRASTRETEIAVRTALGAGRARIVRQLVTESVVLSLLGGGLGLLLASWGIDLLVAIGPSDLPRLSEVRADATVFGFTALIALGTGVVFGLLPALSASRPDLHGVLKESSRGSSSRGSARRVRGLLVVSEMALAVVLLIGAGLLIRSFMRLVSVDPGFEPERVITFKVSAPESKYGLFHTLRRFTAELVTRMQTVPGAQSAAAVYGLPFSDEFFRTRVHIVGTPEEPPDQRKPIDVAVATADYFKTMGIPIIRGRGFTDRDRLGSQQVAVINREAVRRYFPNEDPIGKRVEIGWTADTAAVGDEMRVGGEIVGIIGDVRRSTLASDVHPEIYVPYDQAAIGDVSIVIRSTADLAAVGAAVRSQIRAMDPEMPVVGLRELEELVSESVSQPRFYALLLGVFASIALVLAAVGIYGVISYAVSQRTRELGIRIALGATRQQVIRLVLGQGFWLTVVGVVIGVVAAFYATRLGARLLFGVSATDPLTFVAVSTVLLAVAMLACWLPAVRAARVDPVEAMRAE